MLILSMFFSPLRFKRYILFIITVILSIYLIDQSIDFISLNNYKFLFIMVIAFCVFVTISMMEDESWDRLSLVLMVLLGSFIIVLSNNLILVYLGLELQTFSLFILISGHRNSLKGKEASLKYFILGALSSGLFLLAISILYYYTQDISVESMNQFCNLYEGWNFLKVFFLLSIFFKLSLFPLHFWIPDIYEGSDLYVILLVGSLPKISILGLIFQLELFHYIFYWCCLGSIIVGTFGAINQIKVKRLLAYSGITHMGLCLLAFSLFFKGGVSSSLNYIIVYLVNFSSVIVLTLLSLSYKERISNLSGYSVINITIGLSWCLLLLSMAGLPPLSGFLIKWWVILIMFINNFNFMGLLCIILSAIGFVYYLRISKVIYLDKPSSYSVWNMVLISKNNNYLSKLLLGFLIYISLLLIVNPNPVVILTDYVLNIL